MSKLSLSDRYNAVQEYLSGVPLNQISRKYKKDRRIILVYARRFELYGMEGLKDMKPAFIPTEVKIAAVEEYLSKKLSLKEVLYKYMTASDRFNEWVNRYKQYKAGDLYAFNGGRGYQVERCYKPERRTFTPKPMEESKERAQRKASLSKLSREELYELLLDAQAENELLKKVAALVKKRESRLRANTRRS